MAKGPLPSKERAQEIALQFLQSHAPDLRAAHQLHWIAPHEETITLDGQRLVLTGMKVKMRSAGPDKLWFWVIVGPGEEVMVFERDIFWIPCPGGDAPKNGCTTPGWRIMVARRSSSNRSPSAGPPPCGPAWRMLSAADGKRFLRSGSDALTTCPAGRRDDKVSGRHRPSPASAECGEATSRVPRPVRADFAVRLTLG